MICKSELINYTQQNLILLKPMVLKKEIVITGLSAVDAVFHRRPSDIVRLYFNAQMRRQVGDICSYLARNKKVLYQRFAHNHALYFIRSKEL